MIRLKPFLFHRHAALSVLKTVFTSISIAWLGIGQCAAQSEMAAPPIAGALVDGPRPSLLPGGRVATSAFDHPENLTEVESYLKEGTPTSASKPQAPASTYEPFHWKGLILQSLSFEMLQNATRVMTADQHDRHILLNKPFWSDYWASLNQFNMRRWNDGDSIKVNYIGHPMQGAISGYIQIQNDPRGRELRISKDYAYWKSRYYSFLWSTVYSTWWEIGPLGETAIFNQGGFTYPIRCDKHPGSPNYCELPTTTYTNNTGWVDFIITPIVGTLWLIGEDTLDRYVSDRLVEKDPYAFKYKLIRASLNPPRSLANILRGRYPWWRDYEHPGAGDSAIHQQYVRMLYDEPKENLDINFHSTTLGLETNRPGCMNCRTAINGAGVGVGIRLRRYIDFVTDVSVLPDASAISTTSVGGTMTRATFGLRSGYYKDRYAIRVSLAPGFARYSHTGSDPNDTKPSYNFAASAIASGDYYFSRHFGARASVVQTLIRYKGQRDPDGIGTPPRLSFLSHDNYINSTNWGAEFGPVFRF